MILDPVSLLNTVDNVNEKFLWGETIPPDEALEAARWIASLEGLRGSYRGMFAPTTHDLEHGIRLFTGEKLVCASARHILGQEAARAAWLLGREDPLVRPAYDRATAWMHDSLEFHQSGTFCCGRCTLAFWRHAWVGEFKNKESLIKKGLAELKNARLGDGKWRYFPFYYAVYTLMDIHLEPALQELSYARRPMERYLSRTTSGEFSKRRTAIIKNALALIN